VKKPQTLYRMYDANDVLLYVGITSRGARRFAEHAADKPWWRHVDRIDLEHHRTREQVENAERIAIASERPLHNVVGVVAGQRAYALDPYSNFRWRPESAFFQVTSRRSGRTKRQELVLYYELNGDPISDDYDQNHDSGMLFDLWMQKYGQGATVDIWWFVMGRHMVESAERRFDGDHCYDDYYFPPANRHGEPIEIRHLPVVRKDHRDKGGFIPTVTRWQPTPMQKSVDTALLRKLAEAR